MSRPEIKPLGIVSDFIKSNPRLFFLYCIFSAGIVINNIFIPQYYGSLINGVKNGSINNNLIIGIVVLMILSQIFIFANDIMEIKLYPSLHSYLRDISLKNIIDNQSQSLSEVEAGKFVSRITKFQTVFTGLFDDFRNSIVLFSIVYLFAIGFTFRADKYLGIICTVLVSVVLYATVKNLTVCSVYSIDRDNEFYKMVGGLDDIMTNITNVLNHNTYEQENERLKQNEKHISHHSSRALMCSYKYKVLVIATLSVCTVLFVWRCMYLSSNRQLDSGKILSVCVMMVYVFGIILRNISIFKDITYRYGTLMEILKTINTRKDFAKPDIVTPSTCNNCLISVCNLNVFTDDGKKHILYDLNLHIMDGESISLTGEIGSGKSTLLKVLMKYRNNYTGDIYFRGNLYRDIPSDDLRREVYYIDQKCVLFNRTIYDNIVYGNSSLISVEEVQNMIDEYGLADFFSRFSNGLNTNCGVAGGHLSGGERQVIMLMRMFVKKPRVVLLDEPTSAMDSTTKKYILQLLSKLIGSCTVICITHDNDIAQKFNRNIHMNSGRIVKDIKKS